MGFFDLFNNGSKVEIKEEDGKITYSASNIPTIDADSLEVVLARFRQEGAAAFRKISEQGLNVLAQWVQSVADLYCIELQRQDRGVYKSKSILPESYENIKLAMIIKLFFMCLQKENKDVIQSTYSCYMMLADYIDVHQDKLQNTVMNNVQNSLRSADIKELAKKIADQGNDLKEYQALAAENSKELKRYYNDFFAAMK